MSLHGICNDFAEDRSEEGEHFDSALERVEECFWVSLVPSILLSCIFYQLKIYCFDMIYSIAVVVQMARWQGECSSESSAECCEEVHTTNVL
jgi:hypothetical protein